MRRGRTLIVSIIAAAVVYLVLIAGVDGQTTLAAMGQLGVLWWSAILALSLFNYALRFGRWHVYIRWLGDRVGVPQHATIYLAGFALTTTPGKAGEGLRSVYLARHGVRYAHSLAALLTERFIDLLAIGLLALLAVIAFSGYWFWVGIAFVGLGAALVLIRQKRLLNAAERRFREPRNRLEDVARSLVAAWQKMFALFAPRPLAAGLGAGLLAWAAEGVSVYLIAAALGQPLNALTAIGIYAVAILIGALSFIPGGIGGTEAVMVVLLKLTGIDSSIALAITLIARIATLWFAVAIGLAALATLEVTAKRGTSAT